MDDLAATNQKPASIAPPPASRRPVQRKDDFDDAPTEFLPSKQIGALVAQARGPASVPPPPASRRPPASVPPPPVSSQRPGKFVTGADEDEDGRTFVRGAPRIVKRSVPPSASSSAQVQAMSPAAVIKATLESARSRRGGDGLLMPPPPADLLEDRADLHPADQGQQSTLAMGNAPASVRPQLGPYTAPMGMQPVGVSELGATMLAGVQPSMTGPPPPSSVRGGHMTGPPPPMSQPPQSFRPQAPQSYNSNYPPAYGGAQSSAVPAHFQVAQSPYSDGRLDPPGTSVTSRHRAQGRPASAWAMALVAAGLFVGVGAVAVLQGNDSVMDTTASFVDPSRASKPVGNGAEAQPQPQPQAVAPTVVVPPAATDPNAAPAPVPVAAPPPPVATAAATGGIIGASSPPPAATTPPAPVAIKEPPPPRATAAPPSRPASPPAAAPAPRPPPVVASKPAPAATGDETAEAKPKPTKGAKKGAAGESDEETKKALEALQKAQLESSFGDK